MSNQQHAARQLAEIRKNLEMIQAANNGPVTHVNDATINWMVEQFRGALDHIEGQAARNSELRWRVKRALSGDLYALLTDIQNGIDALGHKDMANSAIQRIDALLTILEGDSA